MARPSRWLAFSCVVFLFHPGRSAAEEPPPRLFVLETEPPSVAAVALDSGESVGRAALTGQPWRMIQSPDGSRIVVLDKGPGKGTVRFGYHPTGKSWATVLDRASLKEVGRAELCWNVDTGSLWYGGPRAFGLFGSDGRRLTLGCTGYRSHNPTEDLPLALVNLDLSTGTITGQVELPRAIDALVALPGGEQAVVYSARETPKNKPALPAELRFVDLATLQSQPALVLEGDPGPPTLSPGGEYLYLLEYGKPDKKPEKNINGRVQVVSVARRAHEANLDAGSAPRGLVRDEEARQVYLLSEGPPSAEKKDERPGELRVIRGADLAATLKVGEEPLFLRVHPDRQVLYVVSEASLTLVDLPGLSAAGPAALKPAGFSLLTSGGGRSTVKELELATGSARGYVLYSESSKLGILDLKERKLLAEITTGRGGVKFAKFLAAAAATGGSYSAASQSSGGGVFFYSVYGVAPANTALVLSPDEKFVYVLNTNSNDVTIVNAETREVVDKIGVGGSANRLELLPGGKFVAVTTGADTLHLIETATNKKVAELPDGGNYRHSPDGRYAAAIGKGVVYCLEGSSLKTLARATGFKKPVQLLFASPAPR